MVRAELLRAAGVVTVAVRLDGVIDGRAPAPADLRYRLVAQPDGQGELDITFRTNIEGTDPAKPGIERVADHRRWLADGSGVATVRVTEGDLGDAAELLARLCRQPELEIRALRLLPAEPVRAPRASPRPAARRKGR